MAATESIPSGSGQSFEGSMQNIINQQKKLALDNAKANLEMAKWQSVLDLAKKQRG